MTTRATIPFLDLGALHASIDDELRDAFERVLAASAFIGGPELAAFEEEFSSAHGRARGVGCASGTDALALALRAAGIGPGDEVVVPAMTFVATAEAVVHVGATPVVADVDDDTLLLAPESVAAVATERTAAVIPVHLYGHVVPFDHLSAWRDQGWVVVEDAAQAHLATWRDRPVGSVGDAACFSFYPGKNLGALGDGGAVIAREEQVVAAVRQLRDHGRASKYEHDVVGWCSRLDGLQAAFLSVKLRRLPAWTAARRAAAARYEERLGGLVVPWEDGAVHHLLVVRVPSDCRDAVRSGLAAAGIETGIHYPIAVSNQPSMAPWSKPCPRAEQAAGEVLSLPMDPLMSDEDVDEVCRALRQLV